MLRQAILATTLFCGILVCSTATAQSPTNAQMPVASSNDELKTLDAVVVTGTVSGPGMWHVYKDDQHDLWILGTVKPLPRNIEWDSASVRDMVNASQEVLWYPGYAVNVQANIFQQVVLGFNYLRAKNNPDGKSLKQILDPSLYARWELAKAKYMPRNSRVESKRPIIAAEDLLDAAIKRSGLSNDYSFYETMKPTMEEAGVRSNYPQFEVKVTSAAAKAALTDVRRMSLDDANCLSATLDALDSDLPRMVANANAWANGDINSISYAALAKRNALCSDAMMSPEFSAKYGLPNIKDSVADLWIRQARTALGRNAVTVAFVPMENLTGPYSLLERMRALGYTVHGP